jgi:glutamate dehydrogenase
VSGPDAPTDPTTEDPTVGADALDAPAYSDAHRAVLTALADLHHDRPQVLERFAVAALRRVPEHLLRIADVHATARRIKEAFETIDAREKGAVDIRFRVPPTGLDGRPAHATVVEIASEDRPFLLSTVVDELERTGHHVVRSLHPIVGVERGEDGRIERIVPARTATNRESLLHLELEDRVDDDEAAALVEQLHRLVDDVMIATGDFDAMRDRIRAIAEELRAGEWPHADPDEQAEVAALLDWLLEDNLIVLGVREYRMEPRDGTLVTQLVPGSGLGLLRDERRSRFTDPVPLEELPEELRRRLDDPDLFTATRTTRLSTVQRRVRMEYFGLTRRDGDGNVCGEFRLLGLFTRKGYAEPSRTTPVLREKLRRILEREDVVPGSHDEVILVSLFQALPKDELFHTDLDTLHRTLVTLLHAEEHLEVRTLVRVDHHTRTVSALVAVPRDNYSPQLRERIQGLLTRRFGAHRIDVEVSLGDRNEALARFLLHVEGTIPDVAVTELQREVRRLARSWDDELSAHLHERLDHGEAERLLDMVASRLPRAYRDAVTPRLAVPDVLLLDELLAGEHPLLVDLQEGTRRGTARLKAAKRGRPLELSGFLPILESLGLVVTEEIPHHLTAHGRTDPDGERPPRAQLHDFGVRADGIRIVEDGPRVADAVLAAWRGHLIVDSLNRLVLTARMSWRDVAVLRAYRRYRRQIGTAYTPEYVNDALVGHPRVARALVAYVAARFDPRVDADVDAARQEVVAALDELQRLDHDRILRGFLHLVDATLRTNAYRPDAVADGSGEPYLSFKFDPSRVPGVPQPVPYREIFVHSPRVEGVHLRGGPVARGGLRWSDRKDDVRTEVLDLVKAQILKNAVIVPTGAKGGFVLTAEPEDPEARRDEVRRQYVNFVRGLLDVTDDLDGDEVVPPPHVVRHDGDDPYLVVAADRGTATFSDTANELAARYGFWLGDAFASGGSSGYDHKALGVTARGAWVAVQRHFRELGVDVQTEPVTVVGIGDMSGDVFGNGLLRSEAVKLVAAFDHRHVFLDPDPDPARSFAERRRLFALPRSSWEDYDPALISEGGGVYARAARSIPLSPQVQALLRVDADELSPPELIRAILCAPVDLLFAGGIGTYVKSSDERNDQVGDRANDELRVDAADVRARVIGEGANLSITQRGRIEYARRGGRINQDAIDNAAGVSTSDHEVNLKILLTLAVESGDLDPADRRELLASLADDVVADVLREVDLQTAALSMEVVRSPSRLDAYDAFIQRLERTAGLDREVEILPSSEELAARATAGAGLTRPELATLLAWSKRELKETLLASDVPDQPLLQPLLAGYFPDRVTERFGHLLPRHRLRRELVATAAANDLVDRMGTIFVSQLEASTGASATDIVLAYQVARRLLQAERWWDLLEAATATHDPSRLLELEEVVDRAVARITATLAMDPLLRDPVALLERDAPIAEVLREGMLTLGSPDQRRARLAYARWLVDDLMDPDLARFLACANDLAMIPDVAVVQAEVDGTRPAVEVADAFLRLGEALTVDRLEEVLDRADASEPWARRQRGGLANDLRRLRRDAAAAALRRAPDADEPTAVARFLEERAQAVERVRAVTSEVEASEDAGLEGVAVAVRTIRDAIDRGA